MTVGDVAKLALAALLIGAVFMMMQRGTEWVTTKLVRPATS